ELPRGPLLSHPGRRSASGVRSDPAVAFLSSVIMPAPPSPPRPSSPTSRPPARGEEGDYKSRNWFFLLSNPLSPGGRVCGGREGAGGSEGPRSGGDRSFRVGRSTLRQRLPRKQHQRREQQQVHASSEGEAREEQGHPGGKEQQRDGGPEGGGTHRRQAITGAGSGILKP